MTITVRFFASLADRVGRTEELISSDGIQTARDAWMYCVKDISIPGNAMVAINREYSDFDAAVKEGDEIAFFPPVNGG